MPVLAPVSLMEGIANMRIPTFILEHPWESLIAGLLLLVLVFGSADRHAAETAGIMPGHTAQLAATEKM
jgi:hypothetical protein